jgi:hypothetical protein
MQPNSAIGLFFWGFLLLYGALMLLLSPRAATVGGFFNGEDSQGRSAAPWLLTSSIFISWIFAKSVTNAANLGASYGLVGGLAYAMYWLSIPLTGFVIYRLRRRFAATGLVSFLSSHYAEDDGHDADPPARLLEHVGRQGAPPGPGRGRGDPRVRRRGRGRSAPHAAPSTMGWMVDHDGS